MPSRRQPNLLERLLGNDVLIDDADIDIGIGMDHLNRWSGSGQVAPLIGHLLEVNESEQIAVAGFRLRKIKIMALLNSKWVKHAHAG
ncbi:MAG: hypothetical protein EA419_11015 [Wenzhouxiangella sp.]|nr:MAG: hypothetical protein EA419_11015 [Wenzhouxiangella sp.]